MNKIGLISIISLFYLGVYSQENITTTPRGKWRVSKEYDDQGNIIAYDSVYVWSSGNIRDFESFKNDSLTHHFKGFIRDFEIPNINFMDRDSLILGLGDFFRGFEFPDLNFEWFDSDSLGLRNDIPEFLKMDRFDFEKRIDDLRKQLELYRKEFEEKSKNDATESKKNDKY